MPSDIAVSVRGLSKSYTIAHQREKHVTLAEQLLAKARRPFARTPKETFWALKDVEFDIRKGDVVGIIGRNGAGKSTLLKILSRITEPTAGTIDLYGRVGSLLEVGTGFHPELTGRENIFLNGAILGMTKAEIRKQFDAIVNFAGVEQFLDTPVKRYSSGMYIRLAFAVAAHLDSEILIVDEVLAVGDAEFQRKCLGKIKDVGMDGRTVLFVSHHMQSIQVLCSRCLYLERGKPSYVGSVLDTINQYIGSFSRQDGISVDHQSRPGTGEMRFTEVRPAKGFFSCGERKVISFKIRRFKAFTAKCHLSCLVSDENGVTIAQCDSRLVEQWVTVDRELEGELILRTPWLKPGNYRVDLYICSFGILDRHEDACRFDVAGLLPYSAPGNEEATALGIVFADFDYRTSESPHAEATAVH